MDDALLKDFERRLERMEAYMDICNLMSRYEWIHTASDQEGNMKLYALETPGVRQEFAQRIFDGPEGIERNLIKWNSAIEEDLTGKIFQHDLVTPYVVVADDAQTAIGMWNSIGIETMDGADGDKVSVWCWCKYKVDFIKENGEWRFWHFRFYPIIKTRFDGNGWGQEAWLNNADYILPPYDRSSKEFAPDRLKYVCSFRTDTAECDVHQCMPEIPPVRYDTWHDEWNEVERETSDPDILKKSWPPLGKMTTQKDFD